MTETLRLDPTSTAVIVVDMQNAFIDPDGSLARMGVPVERTRRAVPHVQRVLATAREARIPIAHLRFTLKKDFADIGIHGKRFPRLRALGHCVEGSWDAEFYPGLEPLQGEYVLEKNRFSGFFGTPLDTLLRCLRVDTLVVMGVATNVCVESTVRDAFQRDYEVIVPREATASYTEEMEKASLATMGFTFATVVGVEEVVERLAAARRRTEP